MVIFGAGASHDATALFPSTTDGHKDRPPVTDQLFDQARFRDSIGHFSACGALVTDVRETLAAARQKGEARSVEQVLDQIQQQAEEGSRRRQRQLMAFRYYVQEVVGSTAGRFGDLVAGQTNHQTLINRIEEWREDHSSESVCLVTFNYDTLIERALQDVLGLRFQEIKDYIGRGGYTLLKLHGSVNWLQPIDIEATHPFPAWIGGPDDQIRQQLIERAGEYEVDDGTFQVVADPKMIRVGDNFAVPAIAIPIQGKRSFVCPADYPNKFKDCLRETTKLMLVGWRGAEAHFLALWRGNVGHGLDSIVVTGSTATAGETWERIGKGAEIAKTATFVGDGFTGLLAQDARLVREFLAT